MQYTVHKTRGTCKFVVVEADRVQFDHGALSFYRGGSLVIAYAPWAWKSVYPYGD